jgi:hypothetical protein
MNILVYLRTDANNYIGFYYNETVGGTANWFARCCSGGVLTAVNTNVVLTLDWFNLEVWVKTSGFVEFRINGKLVATIETNIPSGFLEPYLYLQTLESAEKRINYDCVSLEQTRY